MSSKFKIISKPICASLLATGLLLSAATASFAQGMGNMPGMDNMPGMGNMPAADAMPGASVAEGAAENGAPAEVSGTATPIPGGMPMAGNSMVGTGMPMMGMGMMGMPMMGMPMMGMPMMGMPMAGMGPAGSPQAGSVGENTDQRIEALERRIDALIEIIERREAAGSGPGLPAN